MVPHRQSDPHKHAKPLLDYDITARYIELLPHGCDIPRSGNFRVKNILSVNFLSYSIFVARTTNEN